MKAGPCGSIISKTAAPFEDYASKLLERWKEHDTPLYAGGGKSAFTLDVKTNWKLAVENYCESYHLPWIHPGLNAYSRLEDHYHIEEPGAFSGQGTYVYRQMVGDGGETFPDFGGLSEFWDEGAEYVVFEEDIFVVEGMQKGRHGPHFDGGKFSPVMDNPTHVFHEWAANQILKYRDAG